jgi:gamma-glutamylcyclotransferase
MTTLLYAAYGSNLHPTRIGERAPSSKLVGTTSVQGRGLRFHKRSNDGSGKCNIVVAPESIYLAVYELNISEKQGLDRIEGLGRGYEEQQLEVAEFGRCFAYVASQESVDESLVPYSWYKKLVLLGCEYHGVPETYVHAIRNVAETGDSDGERHAKNMALVGRMVNGT